jgi:hypothetical protein
MMQKMNHPTLQPPSNQVIFFCNIGGKIMGKEKIHHNYFV